MAKTRSTLIMDEDLWKRFRMIAILNDMEVSELVEQALREKLERMKQLEQYPEYKDVRNMRVHKGDQTTSKQHIDAVIHSARYEKAKSNGPIITEQSQQQQHLEQEDKTLDKLLPFKKIKTIGESYPDYDKIPYFDIKDRSLVLPEEEEKVMTKRQKQKLLWLTPAMFNLSINLPGINFPATKNEIIKCAKIANTQWINDILKEYLPDRTYLDVGHFNETLLSEIDTKKGVIVSTFLKAFNRVFSVRRRVRLYVNVEDIRQAGQKQKRDQIIQQQEQELNKQQIDTS